MQENPIRIVPVHGEGKSVFHIVDASAPEEEQPCILSTEESLTRARGEALKRLKEALRGR